MKSYTSRFAPLILLFIVVGIFLMQAAYFYPLLPERIASHFGPSGRADSGMDKRSFIVFFGVLLVFETLLTAGIGLIIDLLPIEAINLPNKDYWLNPERKSATLEYIGSTMLFISGATSALMLSVLQMVFRANLLPDPHLGGGVWILLAAFLAFMAVRLTALTRRFRLPA